MLRYKKTIEYIGSRSNVLGKLKNLKTLKPQVVKDLVIQALAGLEDEETMQFTFSDIVRESKSTYVTCPERQVMQWCHKRQGLLSRQLVMRSPLSSPYNC